MKKLMMMCAACAAAMMMTTGCKSIGVERKAQTLATVQNADGTAQVVKDAAGNPIVLDGGWSVDYFQHWNWQEFDALTAKAGQAELAINNYRGGADATNLTALVHTSLDGLTKLAVAVGEAYEKIAGGGAQASTALKTSRSILEYFTSRGGDASKAKVTVDEAAKTLKVDDGSTCILCDAAGNCSDCSR